MMRRIIIAVVAGIALYSGPTRATLIIGFDPAAQVVDVGTSVNVDLTISGLGDFAAPSLSTFDLDVTFDSGILAFSGVTFGDPVLGDQLDLSGFGTLSGDTPGVGVVELFELSFDSPVTLDLLQAGSFTLATLTFDTLAIGTSVLGISINALGDAFAQRLEAEVRGGSITAVPEPATLLLLVIGLGVLAAVRRRVTG